jgi:hypothetical protein
MRDERKILSPLAIFPDMFYYNENISLKEESSSKGIFI